MESNFGLIIYLFFGLGFYIALAMMRWKMFKNQGFWSIFRGLLLGWLLWPVAILMYDQWKDRR